MAHLVRKQLTSTKVFINSFYNLINDYVIGICLLKPNEFIIKHFSTYLQLYHFITLIHQIGSLGFNAIITLHVLQNCSIFPVFK